MGFATCYADYVLMAASELYNPIMNQLVEKIYLSKVLIEFLADDDTADYEDLLSKLGTAIMPSGISGNLINKNPHPSLCLIMNHSNYSKKKTNN